MAEENRTGNRERLIRFLKTGTEGSFYLPGKNKSYSHPRNVMLAMINDGQGVEAVSCIKRVHMEKLYFKREPLLYFLAEATHSINQETKKAAYAIVNDVCVTPMDLFFWLTQVKRFSQFSKGWGAGLRKTVCNWYNSRDPMQIAEFVTRYAHVGRWSHKDVFRLSHIKAKNEGLEFIVKVVCRGFKTAKEAVTEPSEDVQKIIKYFEAVDFVKHSEDGFAVAMKLEEMGLRREHIGLTVLSSAEVWNSLLRNMSVEEVMSSLPALGRRSFLKKSDKAEKIAIEVQASVLQRLQDATAIEQEKINPFFIYIAIRNYVRIFSDVKRHDKSGKGGAPGGRTQKREAASSAEPEVAPKRKKNKKKGKEQGQGDAGRKEEQSEESKASEKAKQTNPEIYEALHNAFRTAVEKNLPVSNKRWLIAVKAAASEFQKGIRGIPSLSALEVMALTATLFKKKEKFVDLGFFTASLTPMKYPDELDGLIQEIGHMAVPDLTLACDPAAPIAWALEKKKKYDVILVLSDGHEAHGEVSAAERLQEYRQEMKLPNTKMVLCGLAAPKLDFARAPGMLDMGGFGVTTPQIIHQFVLDKLDTL